MKQNNDRKWSVWLKMLLFLMIICSCLRPLSKHAIHYGLLAWAIIFFIAMCGFSSQYIACKEVKRSFRMLMLCFAILFPYLASTTEIVVNHIEDGFPYHKKSTVPNIETYIGIAKCIGAEYIHHGRAGTWIYPKYEFVDNDGIVQTIKSEKNIDGFEFEKQNEKYLLMNFTRHEIVKLHLDQFDSLKYKKPVLIDRFGNEIGNNTYSYAMIEPQKYLSHFKPNLAYKVVVPHFGKNIIVVEGEHVVDTEQFNSKEYLEKITGDIAFAFEDTILTYKELVHDVPQLKFFADSVLYSVNE